MASDELIVGIDLGTTNSEIAALLGDKIEVFEIAGSKLLPSCVGLSLSGDLLVGEPAKNQQLLYPDRTIRSIKRKMGSNEKIKIGELEFTPAEVSALILRELVAWAKRALNQPIAKAVITVPAYFSDAQRNATREAGSLAGLEVVRILNEPTAASLAYGYSDAGSKTIMIYDLGGGTFDVSIVHVEGDITEVLASHGNNHLGGDDFNQALLDWLLADFKAKHGIDLAQDHPVAYSRLWWAVEEAKKVLSYESYVTIREESLVLVKGKPLHLDVEISRKHYESLITSFVESTLDSVSRAMSDAKVGPHDLDNILLVGGATRTPLITEILKERAQIVPRQDIHPDLCVALGAGVLASRLAGHSIEKILVDVSPYSFGISHIGELYGRPYLSCYKPIIRRNTPLPVTRSEPFYTTHEYQDTVEINVYQGEDPDALNNIHIGQFQITNLTKIKEPNEVLCRMSLDLDGILKVTAIEKLTGKSKDITINNALIQRSPDEISAAQSRLDRLYHQRDQRLGELFEHVESQVTHEEEPANQSIEIAPQVPSEPAPQTQNDPALAFWSESCREAFQLIDRSRAMLDTMHDEDREEAIELHQRIQDAITAKQARDLRTAVDALRELLFFIEGK